MIRKGVVAGLLFLACQAGFGKVTIKNLFDRFVPSKGIMKVNLNKDAMAIAGMFTSTMGVTDLEVYELSQCSTDVKEAFIQAVKEVKDSSYELFVDSDKDGTRTKVFFRTKGEIIREIVALSIGKGQTMIRIRGEIKPEDIEKVINEHRGKS